MNPVSIAQGDGPIVLGLPHGGTHIPAELFERLTPLGQTLADTDWHIHRLYDGLLPDVTTVQANFHRYVIDANRDPSGESLYPGQNTTGLVPLTDFDGEPLWLEQPDEAGIEARRMEYHTPYHSALEAELQRVRQRHGVAILYDCHSIRSHIPYLFDGRLPDFNIGTNDGQSCAASIEQAVSSVCGEAKGYSVVVNGRFKGGWTTRHYGCPEKNIHAIQMELAQSAYLASELLPFEFDVLKAEKLRAPLKTVLEKLAELAPNLARSS